MIQTSHREVAIKVFDPFECFQLNNSFPDAKRIRLSFVKINQVPAISMVLPDDLARTSGLSLSHKTCQAPTQKPHSNPWAAPASTQSASASYSAIHKLRHQEPRWRGTGQFMWEKRHPPSTNGPRHQIWKCLVLDVTSPAFGHPFCGVQTEEFALFLRFLLGVDWGN
jgi:hypothetical protein